MEKEEETEISYFHFDLRVVPNRTPNQSDRARLAQAINKYMLRHLCYDPRRLRYFLDPMDEDAEGYSVPWTLQRLREINQSSNQYYELWKGSQNHFV
jgi:hypothetical protein